jgi:AraC-like DNA-binding protein
METIAHITRNNAAEMLEETLQSLERTYRIHITIHDHKGLLSLPDGSSILPNRNRHRSPCCAAGLTPDEWQRCLEYCKYRIIRSSGKAPWQSRCWRQLAEVVVPVYRNADHLATLFGGTFRLPDADLSAFSEKYRAVYRTIPVWDPEQSREIALILQVVGNGIVQLASRLYEEAQDTIPGRAGLIRRYFNHHADKNIGIRDLSRHLGLSESRTGHLIKEYFDTTFTGMLNAERIRRAKSLLTENNLTLAEIAEQVGFSNEFYFNRIFKRSTGVPPGAFRNRHLNP